MPLLLPVVVYNGRHPWRAATCLDALRPQAPPGLANLQPELNYLLVDQSSIKPGIVRALLELDRADERRSNLLAPLAIANAWLKRQNNQELSHTVTAWIAQRLAAQFPGTPLPPIGTLEEFTMIFEHSFRTYEDLLEFQAIERGREKGIMEGKLKERRDMVQLLLKNAGLSCAGATADRIEQAPADQLQLWIKQILSGTVPPELVS